MGAFGLTTSDHRYSCPLNTLDEWISLPVWFLRFSTRLGCILPFFSHGLLNSLLLFFSLSFPCDVLADFLACILKDKTLLNLYSFPHKCIEHVCNFVLEQTLCFIWEWKLVTTNKSCLKKNMLGFFGSFGVLSVGSVYFLRYFVRAKETSKGSQTVEKILNGGGSLSVALTNDVRKFFPRAKLLSAYGKQVVLYSIKCAT